MRSSRNYLLLGEMLLGLARALLLEPLGEVKVQCGGT